MPANALLTTFYTLGSIFFVIAIMIILGLAIGTWVAYRKVIRLRNTTLAKVAAKQRSLSSLSTIAPIIITGVVNALLKRRK